MYLTYGIILYPISGKIGKLVDKIPWVCTVDTCLICIWLQMLIFSYQQAHMERFLLPQIQDLSSSLEGPKEKMSLTIKIYPPKGGIYKSRFSWGLTK